MSGRQTTYGKLHTELGYTCTCIMCLDISESHNIKKPDCKVINKSQTHVKDFRILNDFPMLTSLSLSKHIDITSKT